MASTSKHHHELTNGKGRCSVPMWCGGLPSGFCDEDAFGGRQNNTCPSFPLGTDGDSQRMHRGWHAPVTAGQNVRDLKSRRAFSVDAIKVAVTVRHAASEAPHD